MSKIKIEDYKGQTIYYDEVIEAVKKEDCIEYRLVFHNGGASFDGCLQEALDKLK